MKAHAGAPDQQRRLFSEADGAFGRLDIFVANAAQGVFRSATAAAPARSSLGSSVSATGSK